MKARAEPRFRWDDNRSKSHLVFYLGRRELGITIPELALEVAGNV